MYHLVLIKFLNADKNQPKHGKSLFSRISAMCPGIKNQFRVNYFPVMIVVEIYQCTNMGGVVR